VLWRHRSDPVRRARAEVACGPLGTWLVSHLPELEARSSRGAIDPEALGELPDLPIPPDLVDLLGAPAEIGAVLADLIVGGRLGAPHRAVTVNLIARVPPESLAAIASSLGAVPSTSSGYGLASVLADLALTRHRMLAELR
jgi:hypothetical protein